MLGISKGGMNPPWGCSQCRGEAACGRPDFPAGREGDRTGPVLLLEPSARRPSWLGVSCLPRQGTPLEPKCGPGGGRPGWFSWLCPGVGEPAGPRDPSDKGRPWQVLPPTPGALRLSGFPPPGDPLARVPALPTGDHPPGPLRAVGRRGCRRNLVRQRIP